MNLFNKKLKEKDINVTKDKVEDVKVQQDRPEQTRLIASEALVCELLISIDARLARLVELAEVPRPPIQEQLDKIYEQLEMLTAEVKDV